MNKNIIIIGGIILVALLIGGGVLFLTNGNNNSSSTDNTSSSVNQPTSNDQSQNQPVNTEFGSLTFSSSEVTAHNSASDCWLIIEDKVYEVTEYVPLHPGGEQEILDVCGADGTSLFNSIKGGNGHPGSADGILDQLYLGDLVN